MMVASLEVYSTHGGSGSSASGSSGGSASGSSSGNASGSSGGNASGGGGGNASGSGGGGGGGGANGARVLGDKHGVFSNRRRFFQLSNDLTTLRWSWREYLLLDEVVRVREGPQPFLLELHAGTIFERRVLTLRCASAAQASLLIHSLRNLLRYTSLGDRGFTMYALELFKLADRDCLGAITAKNRKTALGFLNMELDKETEERVLGAMGMGSAVTAAANTSPGHYQRAVGSACCA